MSTAMKRMVCAAASVIGALGVVGCQTGGAGGAAPAKMATTVDSLERGTLYDGIEGHHRKISTDSALSLQRIPDQRGRIA